MRGKRFNLGVISVLVALLAVSIAFMGGCTKQSSTGEPSLPVPSTTPVTPGYIKSYDHQLGYEFEYPEDWEMQVPQCESPYEIVEVFTKKGEPTQIKILVKSTNLM